MKLLVVSQSVKHLEPLELNPWRVLVIAAHPGDIEAGTSAAAAKWTKGGAEVIYVLATRGELSMPGIEPEEAALIRSGEQAAAAAAVGVQDVKFLDLDDGTVEPSIRLRRELTRDIRHFGPDVVVIMNHREQNRDGTLNDADHRAVGIAALDAVRSAANQWMFRDVSKPHLVETVLVADSTQPTHAIDVSEFEADAVRAFDAHEQHLVSVANHPMANAAWLQSNLGTTGGSPDASTEPVSSGYALDVERIEYAQGSPCHSFIVEEFVDPDGEVQIVKLPKKTKSVKSQPVRARNEESVAPAAAKTRRSTKSKTAEAPGAMKIKARLEQRGRSIGFEVPASVMERLGSKSPSAITVEINSEQFDTKITTVQGQRFVAVNAERRKAAGIDIDDTFFVALSTPGETPPPDLPTDQPSDDANAAGSPKRSKRRRSPSSRPKAAR